VPDSWNKGKSRTIWWVLLALAIVTIPVLLYAGLGGPDDSSEGAAEDVSSIEAREDVDAVVFTSESDSTEENGRGEPAAGE